MCVRTSVRVAMYHANQMHACSARRACVRSTSDTAGSACLAVVALAIGSEVAAAGDLGWVYIEIF